MQIETVWQEYKNSLKAFLHSKISDPDDVDDLLQQLLIKTYENLSKIKSEQAVKSWLFQVANRSIIDFYRKKAKAKAIEPEELWYQQEEQTAYNELSHCIEPFIHALPNETAKLMQAVEVDGVSQKQYAQELGIPYSTLKSQVQKGRKQLRQFFDTCCQFQLDAKGNLVDFSSKRSDCGSC